MTERIESLTDEQWQEIYRRRDQWLAHGLSTQPSDRPEAEAVITEFYKRLGEPKPVFLWADDPRQARKLAALLIAKRVTLAQARESDPRGLVRELFTEDLSHIEKDQTSAFSWGQEQIYWIGHYSTIRDVVGVEYPDDANELLDLWARLAKSTGWWMPYVMEAADGYDTGSLGDSVGVVICCERPKTILQDEQGVLHCETGPAIETRGGRKLYYWRGEKIPAEWIENPSSVTVETVFGWPNMDQRAAAAEIYGWTRILDDVKATIIEQHPDPMMGTLYQAEIPGLGPVKIHQVKCGTGRDMAWPVPDHVMTVQQAQDEGYEMEPGTYAPEIRT